MPASNGAHLTKGRVHNHQLGEGQQGGAPQAGVGRQQPAHIVAHCRSVGWGWGVGREMQGQVWLGWVGVGEGARGARPLCTRWTLLHDWVRTWRCATGAMMTMHRCFACAQTMPAATRIQACTGCPVPSTQYPLPPTPQPPPATHLRRRGGRRAPAGCVPPVSAPRPAPS